MLDGWSVNQYQCFKIFIKQQILSNLVKISIQGVSHISSNQLIIFQMNSCNQLNRTIWELWISQWSVTLQGVHKYLDSLKADGSHSRWSFRPLVLLFSQCKTQEKIYVMFIFKPMPSYVPKNTHRVLFSISFISKISQRVMSQGKITQYSNYIITKITACFCTKHKDI